MSVEVWQATRPKGRSPRWAFRVSAGGATAFDSAWVAVRYGTREDADWLGGLVERLVVRGAFAGCPGHPGHVVPVLNWDDLARDDLAAEVDGIYCHAEHMSGPTRGGLWYCQVSRGSARYFHTADVEAQPRNREAAWWLCEVIVCAVLAGVWEPMPHNPPLHRTAAAEGLL